MSKKLGLPGAAKDRVAVLTGIHPTPCTTPYGDYYMSLQVPLLTAKPLHCQSSLCSHMLLGCPGTCGGATQACFCSSQEHLLDQTCSQSAACAHQS